MVQMSARKGTSSEADESVTLSAPIRGEVEAQLEGLKEQLLQEIVEKITDNTLVKEITWAANEAAALAWCTVCPILVLPVLLEERVRATFAKWEKQQRVRGGTWQPRQHWASDLVALPAAA
jgi:hypothetical protein